MIKAQKIPGIAQKISQTTQLMQAYCLSAGFTSLFENKLEKLLC
jgi:hypothetical protein